VGVSRHLKSTTTPGKPNKRKTAGKIGNPVSICFTREQKHRLTCAAKRLHVTQAEVLRLLIDLHLTDVIREIEE